ncbi:hypothetical protein HY227_02340 [Candidatus Wolfebacteria bacterium]|nr:hypothetical protein [Candidatus Wolfebacteria bacterium]
MNKMINEIKKILPRSVKNLLKNNLGLGSARNSDVIPYIIKNLRPDIEAVLDVGCGKLWEGNDKKEDILFSVFGDSRYGITGLDISKECIDWRKKNGPNGD